jgi:hypothetical protein
MATLSECARMNSARESRFRIDHPSSAPRVAKVIALDEKSAGTSSLLARATAGRARFFKATARGVPLSAEEDEAGEDLLLLASDGSPARLSDELRSADLVVMVAAAGERAEAAAIIGRACFARAIMTTGVILGQPEREAEAAVTLNDLRPYAAMLVVTSDEEYLAEMLAALRA